MKKTLLASLLSSFSLLSFAHPDFEANAGTFERKEIKSSGTIFFKNVNTGENLDVYLKDGKYYVAGRAGDNYEINICGNKGNRRNLVIVSVDGLNVINGQPAGYNQSGYVISNGYYNTCTAIKGWRKNLNEEARFVLTSVGDSYASRTGNNVNNTGVIGFAIFDEELPPPPPPPVYVTPEASYGGAREKSLNAMPAAAPQSQMMDSAESIVKKEEKLGTGHGERIVSEAIKTEFKRASSTPSRVIAVYYDTYENLEKKGIIIKRGIRPNPFPKNEFAPDPRY